MSESELSVLYCRYALADLHVPLDGSQPSEQQEGAPVMGIVLRYLTLHNPTMCVCLHSTG